MYILFPFLVVYIGQLKGTGVSATHAVTVGQIADIVSGKFRFG